MVTETRSVDYKRKHLDVDRDGNIIQVGTQKLRVLAPSEKPPKVQQTLRRRDTDELLEHTVILQSGPEDEEQLKEAIMTFNKYCTMNKLKDETRQKIDKLESEKRTFMMGYESKRKALWRSFYKYKEAAEGIEKQLDSTKSPLIDPDLKRKVKLEVLGSDTDAE